MARNNAIPPPITGDVYRLVVWSTSQSQVCMNSYDMMGDAYAASAATNMNALMNAWVLANENLMTQCLTTQTKIFRYTLQCISSNAFASIQMEVNKPGIAVTAPLPLEMAAIMRKTGPLKGQHGRGRVYMPGVPAAFTTPLTNPNVLNAAGIAAYQAYCTSVARANTIGGISYAACVSQRPIGPILVVTNAALTPIMNPVSLLGTVRRRREGRGI